MLLYIKLNEFYNSTNLRSVQFGALSVFNSTIKFSTRPHFNNGGFHFDLVSFKLSPWPPPPPADARIRSARWLSMFSHCINPFVTKI